MRHKLVDLYKCLFNRYFLNQRERNTFDNSILYQKHIKMHLVLLQIKNMGLIEIEGMEFYAYHGHFEAERIVGNKFLVNVAIETDCKGAAKSDKLEDALNYQKVYELIKIEMGINSSLLENVAQRILDCLYKNFPMIERAKLKISKMNPPMGGQIEKVSVTLSK